MKNRPVFSKSFIIQNQTKEKQSMHFTHVYIQKNEHSFHFFLSDSLGSESSECAFLLFRLTTLFSDAKKYILITQRQFDNFTCPIFAIKDAVYMTLHPQIFDILQNPLCLQTISFSGSSHPFQPSPSLITLSDNYVRVPPPEMMRALQNSQIWKEYLLQAQTIYPKEDLCSLQAKIQKHQNVTNGRAFYFLCKYTEQILEDFL
ncbi:MAG: hypothetical protein WCP39_00480 [Chlamydiota bacterium]